MSRKFISMMPPPYKSSDHFYASFKSVVPFPVSLMMTSRSHCPNIATTGRITLQSKDFGTSRIKILTEVSRAFHQFHQAKGLQATTAFFHAIHYKFLTFDN
jgi:hypothetical protein